jgi:hypothetical protein
VVGNNNHWGLGGGMDIQWLLNRDPSDYAFCFFAELEATFFVRRHEQRIFDLKCKPWSRYLLLTNRNGPLGNTTPGVNVLTREVKVRPWGAVDLSTGLRINTERMQFEVSYNLWTHPDERVCLRCPFGDEWGIAGTVDPLTRPTFTGPTPPPPAPFANTVTASRSTIQHQSDNDIIRFKETDGTVILESIFVPIRENDLDFNSAEAQGTLNHKASAAIGFIRNGVRTNAVFGFGFYFDYPQKNTALKTAGAWAKVGASF